MKTILVTGGCGFIGAHFVRKLYDTETWRTVNLDKLTYAGDRGRLAGLEDADRYRLVEADIADRAVLDELFRQERPSALVNFAAETHVDRSILDATPFLHTNVVGVQSLLEAAREHGLERFLQISTDEVYGDAEGGEPFTEESPLRPSSPYAASKAAADLLCLAYRRTYGTPALIVRSTNNYGPFQFPEKLIPLMIRNALIGKELPVYGDGAQQRDWLYVEDNCEAILAILERGETGAVFNVSGTADVDNLAMVRSLCRLVAEEAELKADELVSRIHLVDDRPGHDRRYALSSAKIRQQLGWAPKTSLEEGLRATVRWYAQNPEWAERLASSDYEDYYKSVYEAGWRKNS
ncbi:MAG: dTDP-glucose 4,6-dehydratase [Acidobacteriota bacterium]